MKIINVYIEDLFEKYAEWKILKYFLSHPETEIHVKGLARELKVSPGTASKTLNQAAEGKILNKRIIGNIHLYSLNESNKHVKNLKKVVRDL